MVSLVITQFCIFRKREYEGPHDPPGYFEDHVWPSYMRDMKVACGAHSDGSVSKSVHVMYTASVT